MLMTKSRNESVIALEVEMDLHRLTKLQNRNS